MNEMALTERDIELVRLAAKEAAHAVLADSEPDRRRMAREEAWGVAEKAINNHNINCKVPAQVKMSFLKLTIFGLLCGGSGGLVTAAPAIVKLLESLKL
jgi:hypothetical protein